MENSEFDSGLSNYEFCVTDFKDLICESDRVCRINEFGSILFYNYKVNNFIRYDNKPVFNDLMELITGMADAGCDHLIDRLLGRCSIKNQLSCDEFSNIINDRYNKLRLARRYMNKLIKWKKSYCDDDILSKLNKKIKKGR